MMHLLSEAEITELKLIEPVPLSWHPAAVYLGSLNLGSQRAMRLALNLLLATMIRSQK